MESPPVKRFVTGTVIRAAGSGVDKKIRVLTNPGGFSQEKKPAQRVPEQAFNQATLAFR
jgi:hypothetical protein